MADKQVTCCWVIKFSSLAMKNIDWTWKVLVLNQYFTCLCYSISGNLCFLFYSTLFYSCCETRLLLYIFSTICTKLHWLHDTFHDDAFHTIPWKTLRLKFLLPFKIFEMPVFPIEKCSANFQQLILGCSFA